MKNYIVFGICFGLLAALAIGAGVNRSPWSLRGNVCNGGGIKDTCTNYNVLDGTSLAVAETSRTVTSEVEGYSRLVMYVGLTDANTDCTSIEIACDGSVDGGSTYGNYTSRSIASGTGTVVDFADTIARAHVIDGVTTIYDIFGYDYFKCVYSSTGTCASDTVVVQWSLSVGK